jgi:hypothetical protein
MHDIDRVRLEIPSLGQEFEGEALEAEQFEYEDKGPYGHGQLWGEMENMELASELLEVSNELDLDNFIGDLVGKATGLLNGLVSDQKKQALAGILKGAAKQILPAIASSLGGHDPGPVRAKAGRIFGLELEGMSNEDREFEVARRYVDFAGEAARKLAQAAPMAAPAAAAAAAAANAAASVHAPGLPRIIPLGDRPTESGRWEQKGNRIILYEV